MKKTNSINKQKTGRFKNKKQNVSKDYEKGMETIESLKHMISDMTNSRFTGHEANKSEDLIQNLDDESNVKMIHKYLSETKNAKLPITFKKKISDNIVLVSRVRTQSKDQSELYDETDNEELSNHSPNISQGKNTDIGFNKPLLNSKKNLSKLLISGWYPNDSKFEDIKVQDNDEVIVKENSFDKRRTFNDEISQKNWKPSMNKKNLRMMQDIRREANKIRETDPVLLKSKPFLVEKKSFKEFHKVREGLGTNTKRRRKKTTNYATEK